MKTAIFVGTIEFMAVTNGYLWSMPMLNSLYVLQIAIGVIFADLF